MKKYIYLIGLLCLTIALSQDLLAQSPENNLEDLNWLLGKWDRIDAKPGYTSTETWLKITDQLYKGMGVTMKGKDTVFTEILQILIKDQSIYYVATVDHNSGPVFFKMNTINQKGFISSNPDHDFPKEIRYQHEHDKLQAVISGNGKSMNFNFKKAD